MVNHTAKAFDPNTKRNLQGSESAWQPSGHLDFRGNISTVHTTHVKKTTLRDKVADDYLQLCNEGRFAKKCVPRGYFQTSTGQPYMMTQINPSSQ